MQVLTGARKTLELLALESTDLPVAETKEMAAKVGTLLYEATVVALIKRKENGKLTAAAAERKAKQMFEKISTQSTLLGHNLREMMHPVLVSEAANLVIATGAGPV